MAKRLIARLMTHIIRNDADELEMEYRTDSGRLVNEDTKGELFDFIHERDLTPAQIAADVALTGKFASKAGGNTFTGTQDFTAATVTGISTLSTLSEAGAWLTDTVYTVGKIVTQSTKRYACVIPHTSGTFATDLSASKWVLLDAITGLAAANNLSDVGSTATARTNLGLGTAAVQDVGAFDVSGAASSALTAAVSTSAQKASNLSDLNSASSARSNLGLGTAAVQDVSAFDASGAATTAQTNAIASSAQRASNLSDLTSASLARTNLGLGTAAVMSPTSLASDTAFTGSFGRFSIAQGGLYVDPIGSDTTNDGLSPGAPLRTITAAIAKATTGNYATEIRLSPGQHPYGATDGTGGSSTIRVRNNIHIKGTSSGPMGGTGNGSVIVRTVDNGLPMFDSDPAQPLAWFVAEDFQIASQLSAKPTPDGTSHGMSLYCLTNNSAIRRIQVTNMRGDALRISANVTTGDTLHAAFNADITSVFGVGLGGYVVNCQGQMVATIRQPDGTNCRGGLLYCTGGANNQANLVVEQPMWEGGTTTASLQPVVFDNMGGQYVTVIGGTFVGASGSSDVFKVTGSTGAVPLLIGCAGYNFTNWLNNTVSGLTLPMTTKCTYFDGGISSTGIGLAGPGAYAEVWDTAQTANQRRYRFSVSGNIFVLRQYNEAGASVRDLLYAEGSAGKLTSVNAHKFSGNVGFYGTEPVAKPSITGSRGGNAALADLLTKLATMGLLTDGSTA